MTLKLQDQQRVGPNTPGKYARGVHIVMNGDGLLENRVQMEQDVRPLVEELKVSWREKIENYDLQKGELTDAIV